MATYSNLYIDQGSTFSATIDLTQTTGSLNLTGYSAAGTIAKSYDGTSKGSFTTSVDDTNNELDISLTAAETAALKPGRYVYDVIIKSDAGVITRVLEGQINVTPGVTFDAIAPETTLGAGNVSSSESSDSSSSTASKSIFTTTNAGATEEDAYAFIELDAPGGLLPYYKSGTGGAGTGTGSSITVKLRLKETINPQYGRVRLFLANQTFVQEQRANHFVFYGSQNTIIDHHGFSTAQPAYSDGGGSSAAAVLANFPTGGLNQGVNTVTISINEDQENLGEFKYLVIAYEDTRSFSQSTIVYNIEFEISELEITASTHPENDDNTTVFKTPKRVINTFDDEGTHYTNISSIKKFDSISSETGLFKS